MDELEKMLRQAQDNKSEVALLVNGNVISGLTITEIGEDFVRAHHDNPKTGDRENVFLMADAIEGMVWVQKGEQDANG